MVAQTNQFLTKYLNDELSCDALCELDLTYGKQPVYRNALERVRSAKLVWTTDPELCLLAHHGSISLEQFENRTATMTLSLRRLAEDPEIQDLSSKFWELRRTTQKETGSDAARKRRTS
jgi:hypothetical protein